MEATSTLIQEQVDLTNLNTFCIPAKASYFARPQTKNQLQNIISEAATNGAVFVLGGGSNVLFVHDYDGLIINPDLRGKKIVRENENHIWLKLGAGENWHKTVCYCVKKGWGGVENLSLIPGNVGAAPIQNIGAYGVEFENVFESLQAVKLKTGNEKQFNKNDCNFGYRDSIFKHSLKDKYVITDVTIKLDKEPKPNTSYGSIQQKLDNENIDEPSIADISRIVTKIRTAKLPDPEKVPNAGSFFKNPIIPNDAFDQLSKGFPDIPHYPVDAKSTKVPAGWLIERAGWKEKETGKATVHQQQALVIINKGNASGEDILMLSKDIQESVMQMFGIKLSPEVNIID